MTSARSQLIEDGTYWTLSDRSANRPAPTDVHLLPIYDEYLVAYRDRGAVLPAGTSGAVSLQAALVVDGQVVGTWKAARTADGVIVDVTSRKRLTGSERLALLQTTARYGRFLAAPVSVSLAGRKKDR